MDFPRRPDAGAPLRDEPCRSLHCPAGSADRQKPSPGRAGIEKHIHPHRYRHSIVTFLRNQGVPLDVVRLLLGHADPRTTQLYTRLSLSTARIAYDQAMVELAGRKSSGELNERHEPPTRGLEGAKKGVTS